MDKTLFKSHISKKFNEELSALSKKLTLMGDTVLKQFDTALQALEEKDSDLAKKSLKTEKIIHSYDTEIYELGYQIMALRNPVASDLRAVMSILQTTTDLERISDELIKIAKVIKQKHEIPKKIVEPLLDYGTTVTKYLNQTLLALNAYDVQVSTTIIRKKKPMNALYLESIQKLVTLNETIEIDDMTSYLFIAKGLESIVGYARNIAKYIIFFEEGVDVRHQATKEIVEQFSTHENGNNN